MKASALLPLAIAGSAFATPFDYSGSSGSGREVVNGYPHPESPTKYNQTFRNNIATQNCGSIAPDHSHGGGGSIARCAGAEVLVEKPHVKREVRKRRCRHSSAKPSRHSSKPLVTRTASLASVTITQTNSLFPTIATAPGPALPPFGKSSKKRRRAGTRADQEKWTRSELVEENLHDCSDDPFLISLDGHNQQKLRARDMQAPSPLTTTASPAYITVSTAGGSGIFAAAKEQKTNAHADTAAAAAAAAAQTSSAAAVPTATAAAVAAASTPTAAVVDTEFGTFAAHSATAVQNTNSQPTLLAQSEILYVPAANVVSSGRDLYYSSGSIDLPIPTPGVVSPPAGWASEGSPIKKLGMTTAGIALASGLLHLAFM